MTETDRKIKALGYEVRAGPHGRISLESKLYSQR